MTDAEKIFREVPHEGVNNLNSSCGDWLSAPRRIEIFVEDDGPGIANTQNLFVPFFTTKPSGSGIGLVLCRQIAENHGGSLTLENRDAAAGCIARLRLPV